MNNKLNPVAGLFDKITSEEKEQLINLSKFR